jgi:hypothetical protein
MAMADLIPTGRTSLVKRGDTPLQVQTEYAHRPVPRITTTVQKSGQVLQKIERNLEKPIESIEEKNRMETTIRKQHAEVIAIIENSGPHAIPPPLPVTSEPKPYPELEDVLSTVERLRQIPGHHRIFRLDNEGNFLNADVSKEFKKLFKPIFKNLHELIEIFGAVPGVGLMRETGVCEVEQDKLYLLSTGTELYIMYLEHPDYSVDYEKVLKQAVASG